MRVAIIAPEFPPEFGGMQRYAFEVASQLASRGHSVDVLTKPHAQGEISSNGINVLPVLQGNLYSDRPVLRRKSADYDVWHVMNAAWAWAALEVKPMIVSVYGNDFLVPNPVAGFDLKKRFHLPKGSNLDFRLAQWRTPRIMRRTLPMAAHIFACSNYTKSAFLERFPQCQARTSVAYVGVSSKYFEIDHSPKRPDEPTRLLTVCRLSEPRKNVDVVLRALARLKDRCSFRYRIVGDGATRADLEKLAADLNLSDRVEFLGFVDEKTLMDSYSKCDLFILTSALSPDSMEGFGIVYLEANAAGVPTLAARLGGAIDALEENTSGMFTEGLSDESVSDAIARFLSGQIRFDPDKCRGFARRFTWATIVDRILDQYPRRQGEIECR
jgi:phosphatidylinositol alpha-1,6-mannosyltransferase